MIDGILPQVVCMFLLCQYSQTHAPTLSHMHMLTHTHVYPHTLTHTQLAMRRKRNQCWNKGVYMCWSSISPVC